MNKTTLVIGSAAVCAITVLFATNGANEIQQSHFEQVLGTSLDLKIRAASPVAAREARQAILAEFARQEKILSGYEPDSEFSRWMETQSRPVRVSRELFEVLDLFDQWRTRTGGALNPAAEGVVDVWKRAAKEQRLPAARELSAAAALAGARHWTLDAAHQTATHLDSAPVRLNSFTKSYISGHAADRAFAIPGVEGVVVNCGGDIVVRGRMREEIAIANPFSASENSPPATVLAVENRTVATSGDYRRGVDIGGAHYSHIVDPRTGQTAEAIASATVVASDPSTAGALATAFSVMTPAESQKLAGQAQVEYLLIARNGERIASRGWNRLALAPAQKAAVATADTGIEVAIQLELAKIGGFRYERPYVAVWVEDPDKFPVRTIALWYKKDRWLPEMKAWYRGDRLRSMAEGTEIARSISSATRPAGKYNLVWDGKDNTGKPVKPGRYTLYIEASREHGTYQLMHQELDLSAKGQPQQFQLPGGTELAGATIDYRKTTGH
jgi:FAD:protein FMN transferase